MTITGQAIPGAAPSRRKLLALGTGGLVTGAVGVAQLGSATAAAAASGTSTPDWLNVTAYGADPTGASDAAGAFNDAVTALGSAGGVIYVPAGTYTVGSEITCTAVPVYFVGDGPWATVISFTGSGDCFRVYDSTAYGDRTKYGGGFVGITLDGTHAQAGSPSCGLHLGDVFQYELDLTVQNFTEAASIGVHLDNAYYWTEQLHGRIYAQQCTSHVVFDSVPAAGVTTATGSFDRCDLDVYIDQADAAYDGVVLQNGTFIVHGSLKIRGNFAASAKTVSSAVLRLTGSTTATSGIIDSMIDIGVECGAGTTTPSYAAQTIAFGADVGTAKNSISNCYGGLFFVSDKVGDPDFTASNNTDNVFNFMGQTVGDHTLPGQWATYATGLPTGITGDVAFRILPTGQEVMVTWALSIASGTVLTNGQSILTANPKFAYSDTKVVPGNLAGGGLSTDTYAPAYLSSGAVFQYHGPTHTATAAAKWYGQGIYTLSLG